MSIDTLMHARAIMDIQVDIKEVGHATVFLGTAESKALIEGNKLINNENIRQKLIYMVDHGHAIFDREDWFDIMKAKAALAEAGGQPLQNPNRGIDE